MSDQLNNEVPVVGDEAAVAPTTEKPVKEKKKRAPQAPRYTRFTFLVDAFKSGVTGIEELATQMEAAINDGRLSQRPTLRKLEVSHNLWVRQVYWYLHEAFKKGLLPEESKPLFLKAKEEHKASRKEEMKEINAKKAEERKAKKAAEKAAAKAEKAEVKNEEVKTEEAPTAEAPAQEQAPVAEKEDAPIGTL